MVICNESTFGPNGIERERGLEIDPEILGPPRDSDRCRHRGRIAQGTEAVVEALRQRKAGCIRGCMRTAHDQRFRS